MVAGLVAELVVHFLEAVEIDEGDGHFLAIALAFREFQLQTIRQQDAVGQSGQAVVIGVVFQLTLLFLLQRDVGEQSDVVDRIAVRVEHGADGQQFGIDLAGFAPVPDFTGPVIFGLQFCPHIFVELVAVASGAEVSGGLADDFLAAVAGDFAESGIGFDDAGVQVGDDDAFVCAGEHAGEQLQLLLRENLTGDELAGAEGA